MKYIHITYYMLYDKVGNRFLAKIIKPSLCKCLLLYNLSYISICMHIIHFTYLQGHVVKILVVFACSGVILAMIELLGVVLACCLANNIAYENREKRRLKQINRNQEHLGLINPQHLELKVSDL